METVLMEERRMNLRRKGKEHSYRFDQEQEDPLLAIGTALLFRSAFGRSHSRLRGVDRDIKDTDYSALRSKKHLKCSR